VQAAGVAGVLVGGPAAHHLDDLDGLGSGSAHGQGDHRDLVAGHRPQLAQAEQVVLTGGLQDAQVDGDRRGQPAALDPHGLAVAPGAGLRRHRQPGEQQPDRRDAQPSHPR